ncbi:hypothetical protein DRP77_09560 [Candidatus Poribacteria bacterium]|nr:MAG: hypothetical protein DRP77_09560 [Candidatus Poribacteria bacterium]
MGRNSEEVRKLKERLETLEKWVAELEENLTKLVERSYKLGMIIEVMPLLNSTLDMDELLVAIMESAQIVMQAEAGSLMMVDEQTGDLIVKVATGPIKDQITGMRIPKGEGIAGWVAEHGRSLLVADVEKDKRFYPKIDQSTGFRTKSILCTPIKLRDKVIGVVEVINRNDGSNYSEDDITLLETLAHQAAIVIERAQLHQAALEKQRLEHELLFARQIQERFLPDEPPRIPGVEIAAKSEPSTQVGGDYYDFIPLPDGRIGIAIGDVSGKDIPAALLMATARMALRTQAEEGIHSPSEILFKVNNTLYRDTSPERFLTLFYGVLDVQNLTLNYVNGAHNPPILYNTRSGEMRLLEVGGTLVGMFENAQYEEDMVQLKRGDVLVMYTDGITESMNASGEMFGEERLKELIVRHGGRLSAMQLLQRIYDEVRLFSEGMPQHDDLTLIVMKVT